MQHNNRSSKHSNINIYAYVILIDCIRRAII